MTSAGDQAVSGSLRILHWNIHSWRNDAGRPNADAVARVIAAARADVISLVEVNEPWGAPAVLPELARRAGYAWIFCPAVELGQDLPTRGYGNALLTRLPVEAVQQWRLTWPPVVYNGTEPSESRTVALVRVSLDAGPVWVGSTHLPSTKPDVRAAALRRLTALTDGLEAPWLICGDFNVAAAKWTAGESGGAAPQLVVAPKRAWPTHPTRFPVHPIDYCIASPGMQLAARVLAKGGSDHLPLLVEARSTGLPSAPRSTS